MTNNFWVESQFKAKQCTKFHNGAINMYKGDDYRVIVCNSENTIRTLSVIAHELGHIQSFMHLKHLPAIFQDATNFAIGEAIGGAIYLAMITPQHLSRLRLLSDEFLGSSTTARKNGTSLLGNKVVSMLR